MNIEILGPGCKNCTTLERETRAALATLGIEATLTKVTDYAQIMGYGVMRTPGLVIDGQVVSTGKVLKAEQIISLIQQH